MTVLLDNGHEVAAQLCGKMMIHHIRCLAVDRVLVELSSYVLTMGQITCRFK